MKHYIFIILFLTSLNALSQIEKKYDKSSNKLPNWVKLMYADEPNVGNVIKEYENYLKNLPSSVNFSEFFLNMK